MAKFKIEPHFRLQEWVAEEKGYFRDEGLDYEFKEFIRSSGGAHHATSGHNGAFQSIEKGRESNVTCACHWTVNVAASRGHTKLFADAYSVAPSGIFVAADFRDQGAERSRRCADFGRLPVGQPLRDHPGARKLSGKGPDQAVIRRGHAVQPHGSVPRGQGAGRDAVRRSLLLRRATGLSQDHRHHLHDRRDGEWRS